MNEFKPFEQPSKTKVAIVAGGRVETIPLDLDVYVGVDAGCLFLLEQGLELSLAVEILTLLSQKNFRGFNLRLTNYGLRQQKKMILTWNWRLRKY